jgi:hypothetical protein
MQPRPTTPSALLTRRRIAAGLCAAAALALAPLSAAAPAVAATPRATSKLKLPAERTSPTGNFFTLEAYVAPSASKPVANFEVKVCTSAHTPAGTALEPSFFTLSLAQGGIVAESTRAAKSPALVPTPLRPKQCTQGWLGFSVPKGKTAAKLEYEYNGLISWTVG